MLEALIFGLFGLIIGSFLNVVILRHAASGLGGRSGCLSCTHQLEAADLIPVFSWLLLDGKCRYCKSRISIQYPLVELGAAILFACIGFITMYGFALQILWLLIVSLLIIIAVYDIRHTIIPTSWAYAFAIAGLGSSLSIAMSTGNFESIPAVLMAGPVVAFPLFLLWDLSAERWMGLGDVRLALGMGWLLGIQNGFFALMLSFIVGAVISVGIIIPFAHVRNTYGISRFGKTTRGLTMKSEVAFGPFLVLATIIVWLLNLHGFMLVPYFV